LITVSKRQKSIAGLLAIALVMASVTIGIFAIMSSTTAKADNSPNLDPTTALNVSVVNSSGAPISGANVTSFLQPTGQEQLAGFTNVNGSVSFTNLTAGGYQLIASKAGYANGFGNASVQYNETTSITITLGSATQLLLSTNSQQYHLGEPISITAEFIHNGKPVTTAITSVEVRDPDNNLVYISTGQTDQTGTCTFEFSSGLNWLIGYYSVLGVSYSNGVGTAAAQTSFRLVKLVSDVSIESAWIYNPASGTGQNLTIGPFGEYWSIGILVNYGNGSAYVSNMKFEYPANLAPISIRAILEWPQNVVLLNYTKVANTIYVNNVTLPSNGALSIVFDANITKSASYTSTTTANWQDTNLLFEASGTRSLTLSAVWDTANPILITSFANTGTNSTGGFINIATTLENAGSSNITFVCTVQVTDSNGVPLTPVTQSVTLAPGESQAVDIELNIPSSSPTGIYAINFSLFTALPSNGGHAINYEQAIAMIS
jgi:hypothetical protein